MHAGIQPCFSPLYFTGTGSREHEHRANTERGGAGSLCNHALICQVAAQTFPDRSKKAESEPMELELQVVSELSSVGARK